MGKWIDDSKIMYLPEDLAYKLICYINLDVMEGTEFRKSLDVKNNQSIRIDRSVIAIIMKIFAKEIMGRQYKIPGLPYLDDLCFVVHKLLIEIDEDGHPYYENHEIRKKLTENLGFTFIRIKPDPDADTDFDLDVEIAKIYNYINEPSLKLAVNSTKKSLKEKFAKEILGH